MAYIGALSRNGDSCRGTLNFPTDAYPHICGHGVLQLAPSSSGTYAVVLQNNLSNDRNAFRPSSDNGTAGHLYLGMSDKRWRAVYAATGTIQTSDRNAKYDITQLDPEKAEAFVMGLKPSVFKFNDGTSGRTHWGMISQDIEELLPQIGMTDMDFAGFIKSPKTDDDGNEIPGEYLYSLRYDEFIAPLIAMVQNQQKQIENLERRLSALENKEEAL